MTGRRRPEPYWLAECTTTSDQGVVEAWITDRGRPALVCDVCHDTWFDPALDPGAAVSLDDPTGRLPDGDRVYAGDSRPATRAELERLGWWERVSPLSRETNTNPP
jgi:hypothetical protein